MSLDVYLYRDPTERLAAADLCEEHGLTEAAVHLRKCSSELLYDANITHNLNKMADAAGIYKACWRPEEIGIRRAGQLIPLLFAGICKLKDDPSLYRQYDSPNGWGRYDDFVPWLEQYLAACLECPDALVKVSR